MSQITWIEIDLDNVAHNIRVIREKVGKDTKILAVIKADAYGHGAVEISKTLVRNSVDMLGVAYLGEAIELRENGINIPILILNPFLPEQVDDINKYSLEITICNFNTARELSKTAKRNHCNIKVHMEVDTGMGGAGVHPDKTLSFIKDLLLLENITLEGIFTHFHSSEVQDKTHTHKQNKTFKTVLKQLEDEGIHVPLKHAANSAAILDMPNTYFNMIRPGLILYGIYPSCSVSKNIDIKPVMTFKTRIINLKILDPGNTVGYGRTFKVSKQTRVATIPVGYKDGFSRYFSNVGKVLVNRKLVPIMGRICMDRCFIDVTNLTDINIGSEVTLFGSQKDKTISIESAAVLIDTIPYEIVCNIGRKVPKIFKHELDQPK